MYRHINNDTFKKGIIVFWAAWWLVAFWTDLVGTFAHMGWLNASWAPDMNYPALHDSMQMYNVPEWFVGLMFIGIILWLFVTSVAFVYACVGLNRNRTIWMKRAQVAFIISMTLWLAFFLGDQVVMKFDFEQNHMVQGGFELLTYFALFLLPDR